MGRLIVKLPTDDSMMDQTRQSRYEEGCSYCGVTLYAHEKRRGACTSCSLEHAKCYGCRIRVGGSGKLWDGRTYCRKCYERKRLRFNTECHHCGATYRAEVADVTGCCPNCHWRCKRTNPSPPPPERVAPSAVLSEEDVIALRHKYWEQGKNIPTITDCFEE